MNDSFFKAIVNLYGNFVNKISIKHQKSVNQNQETSGGNNFQFPIFNFQFKSFLLLSL